MTFERETLAEDAVKLGFSHAGLAKIETLKPMDEGEGYVRGGQVPRL